MKKSMIVIVLFLIAAWGANVSALSTNLKQDYSSGESIIVKLIGKITEPVTFDKIKFVKEGHVQEVPMEYGVNQIGGITYIWAIAPKTPGNYTILINNVRAIENGLPKEINFQQNFSVAGNSSSYAVKPGTVIADENFSIKIISYENNEINIDIDFPESKNIEIEPGENTILFSMDKFTNVETRAINIGKYALPAYLIGDLTKTQASSSLQVAPLKIKRELRAGEDALLSFTITNAGNSEIKGIEIIYPNETFYLYPDEKINLKADESAYYNLTLKKKNNVSIREVIYARAGDINAPLPVSLDFSTPEKDRNSNTSKESKLYRCAELGGKICKGEEVCNGVKNLSLEGICCVGSCTLKEAGSSSSSKIFGYVLAIIVVLGLGYLYWRYKQTKGEKDIFPRKIKEAEKRNP